MWKEICHDLFSITIRRARLAKYLLEVIEKDVCTDRRRQYLYMTNLPRVNFAYVFTYHVGRVYAVSCFFVYNTVKSF